MAAKTTAKKPKVNKVSAKAVKDRSKYTETSIFIIDGSGQNGCALPPFNYQAAVDCFNGLVHACITKNSDGVASMPLRLYVPKQAGRIKLFNTKPVPKWYGDKQQKAYLLGDLSYRPSNSVLSKTIEFRDQFEEVTESHPITNILAKPNPELYGFSLLWAICTYLQLTGNSYLHVIQNEHNVPGQIDVMPSQWTDVIPAVAGNKEYLIDGYSYGQYATAKQRFETDEVIQFKMFNPDSLLYGKGYVEAGWTTIQTVAQAELYDYQLYKNRARPDYCVVVKNGFTDSSFKRFNSTLNSKLKGVENSGKFVVLDGDASIQPLSWSPKDMGSRTQELERFCAIFKMSITQLQTNAANYSNSVQGNASWIHDSLLPLMRLIEDTLNYSLLPMFGIEAFVAFDNPLPEDRKYFDDRDRMDASAGLITWNEWRIDRGYESTEWGDKPRVNGTAVDVLGQTSVVAPGGNLPTAITPVDAAPVADQPQAAPVSAADQPPPPVSEVSLNGAQIASAVDLIGQLRAGMVTATTAYELIVSLGIPQDKARRMIDAEVAAPAAPVIAPVAPPKAAEVIETKEAESAPEVVISDLSCECESKAAEPLSSDTEQLQTVVKETLTEIKDELLNRLQNLKSVKALSKEELDALKEQLKLSDLMKEFNDQLTGNLEPIISAMVSSGAIAGLTDIGIDPNVFSVTNPKVAEFMRNYTIRLAKELTTETTNQISNTLADGLDAGDNMNELTRRIEETPNFSEMGINNRAELIARTEERRSHESGKELGWQESDVVAGKEWLLAPHACSVCIEASKIFNSQSVGLGETPKGLELGNTITGSDGKVLTLDYSDISKPPCHPQCRCTLLAVLKKD